MIDEHVSIEFYNSLKIFSRLIEVLRNMFPLIKYYIKFIIIHVPKPHVRNASSYVKAAITFAI